MGGGGWSGERLSDGGGERYTRTYSLGEGLLMRFLRGSAGFLVRSSDY